ncbi:MAG: HNH endonuclease [Prevotella sp.]|nr:HNH endonuclease [Prevotella sp.]
MKYWIAPSKDSTFRIGDAIKAQHGMADWRTDKFAVGDIVFIYKTKPEQCIRYKMEVVKAKIIFDEALEQENFWTDKDLYYHGITSFYARLKLIEEYTDDILSLHHLHEHGLLGNLQGVQQCKDEGLLEFLLHPKQIVNDDVYDVDYPEDDEKLYEGALITVKANKYERNQKARRECVAQKGYKCLVCGCDFEATYGEIGKRFIHVHHLTPISSIGKEYQLDVEKDLVPVCPNCHYMIHRKTPPYTIEELKEELQKVATPAKKRSSKKATEIRFVAEAAILRDVNDDPEVRKLIHNMMEMDGGTMMKNILSVCISMFQERYNSMKPNDWRHLVDDYVRAVIHRPDLQEDEVFYFKVTG